MDGTARVKGFYTQRRRNSTDIHTLWRLAEPLKVRTVCRLEDFSVDE